MKNVSIISPAFLLFIILFISQTAQAQWVDGATVHQSDNSKKVGIGIDDPNFQLEVKGSLGLRSNANSTLGYMRDDGSGNLSISSASTSFIGGTSKKLLLNPPPFYGKSGTVGIGTADPTEAKLVVKGDVGHTVAMFGQGEAGISLVRDWATVGFNAYFGSGAWKAMSKGYGALLGCDPTTGRVEIIQNGFANGNEPVAQSTPFFIDPTGNVAVGNGVANAKLTVNNPDFYKASISLEGNSPYMQFRQGADDAEIGFIKGWGGATDAYGYGNNKGLEIGTPPSGGRLMFSTEYVRCMNIEANGNVLIGTNEDHGYKLAVNGKVICTELKVQLKNNWPDYVFAGDYKLKPLEEVEQHIKSENHLSGIPSAAEVEKEGIEVGEMQKKMMEKIEELTLYVIEINKENKALKQRVEQLENNK